MSSLQSDNNADTEDKYAALFSWWERHKNTFSSWYLGLSIEAQKSALLNACPDMPIKSAVAQYDETPHSVDAKPTNLLLPELNQEAFLASNGKILILFMARRLSAADYCFVQDVALLYSQFKRKIMPLFSQGKLVNIDTPFVDPLDQEERVQALSPQTSQSTRDEVRQSY